MFYKKASLLLKCLFALLIVITGTFQFLKGASAQQVNPTAPDRIFLPIVLHTSNTLVLGIYPENWWVPMPQDGINQYLKPVDTWSGKRLTIAGVFHYLNQPNVVDMMLTPMWNNGYTPFVNLYANTTASNIANGGWDQTIHEWAKDFALYADGGRRMAFLAPLQEMNWRGNPYSRDPANFIKAYKRIQSIFTSEKVPAESVRWVFAPNGYSDTGDPPFEDYYPGDAYVDVVAFSCYNFGTNPSNPYPKWVTPAEAFNPYLQRMSILAPTKPIFISQTGTTAYGGSKNQWLQDAYHLLAGYSQVKAIIYYNAYVNYDWAFYVPSKGIEYSGYREGVAGTSFKYISPGEISKFVSRTSTR